MHPALTSRLQSCGLSFLAAYVDTLGFIALFGLFTAHVTGNFILIGAAMADSSQISILLKFLAFPAFIAGVAAARLLIAAIQRRQGRALAWSLLLQLALLLGFMGCGMVAEPVQSATNGWVMAAGLLGTASMGVHSAISRLLLAHLAPTSLMTGNVTQIVIDGVDMLRGAADAGTSVRCAKFLWPVLCFGTGAIAAAFAWHFMAFLGLLVPALVLFALTMWEFARPAAPASAAAAQ